MYDEVGLKQICESGPEIMIFYMIREAGGFNWHMNHDMAHDRIDVQDHAKINQSMELARTQQKQLVSALTRFGLTQPLDEQGRPTDEYWTWYRRWDTYERSLTEDEFDQLDAALTAHADVSMWRPRD